MVITVITIVYSTFSSSDSKLTVITYFPALFFEYRCGPAISYVSGLHQATSS